MVAYLSGELRQRRTGVGWASLRDVPAAAQQPTLGVSEVDAVLESVAGMAGAGSQARPGPGGRPACSSGPPSPSSSCCADCSPVSCGRARSRA